MKIKSNLIMNNKNCEEKELDDFITISSKFKKEELVCSICEDYLNKQIYRCIEGPHYVCGECHKKIKNCPICREYLVVRFNYLEEELKSHLTNCRNFDTGCTEKIYPWDLNHLDDCKFAPLICPFCETKVEHKLFPFFVHLIDCKGNFIVRKSLDLKLGLDDKNTLLFDEENYIIFFVTKNENVEIFAFSCDTNIKYIEINFKKNLVEYNIKLPVIHKYLNFKDDNKALIPLKILSNSVFLNIIFDKKKESFIYKPSQIIINDADIVCNTKFKEEINKYYRENPNRTKYQTDGIICEPLRKNR